MGLQTEIAEMLHKVSRDWNTDLVEWWNIPDDKLKQYWRTNAERVLAKMREVIEGVENPYGDDVHLDAGVYDGLYRARFEEARQAILKAMDKEG